MEFAEKSLENEILYYPGFQLDEAVEITASLSENLRYFRSVGVVHNDVKPGNIFLYRQADGTLKTKLGDFGIAKGVAVDRYEGVGTPGYMAPEAIFGIVDFDNAKEVERSEIYSLALIVYEMIKGKSYYLSAYYGHKLFSGTRNPNDNDPFKLVVAVLLDGQYFGLINDPILASEHGEDKLKKIDAVLEKALRESPKKRQRNLDHFVKELQVAISDNSTLSERLQALAGKLIGSNKHL